MTSTPSRSKASTRISRPGIKGPTSALAGVAVVFLFFAAVLILFIVFCLAGGRGRRKNPRPLPAVGDCRKLFLTSTRTQGAVADDDHQRSYLSILAKHGRDLIRRLHAGQGRIPLTHASG